MFQATPESLNHDIINPAAFTVHTDFDVSGFQYVCKSITTSEQNERPLADLSIALDSANAAACHTSAAILEKLGAKVVSCCDQANGENINLDCGCTHPDTIEKLKGVSGSTVHRLLKYNPSRHAFAYNPHNHLPIDVLIVDEVSMIDVAIMDRLLGALPKKTKVILLGEHAVVHGHSALAAALDRGVRCSFEGLPEGPTRISIPHWNVDVEIGVIETRRSVTWRRLAGASARFGRTDTPSRNSTTRDLWSDQQLGKKQSHVPRIDDSGHFSARVHRELRTSNIERTYAERRGNGRTNG